jgi:hypothetical protein
LSDTELAKVVALFAAPESDDEGLASQDTKDSLTAVHANDSPEVEPEQITLPLTPIDKENVAPGDTTPEPFPWFDCRPLDIPSMYDPNIYGKLTSPRRAVQSRPTPLMPISRNGQMPPTAADNDEHGHQSACVNCHSEDAASDKCRTHDPSGTTTEGRVDSAQNSDSEGSEEGGQHDITANLAVYDGERSMSSFMTSNHEDIHLRYHINNTRLPSQWPCKPGDGGLSSTINEKNNFVPRMKKTRFDSPLQRKDRATSDITRLVLSPVKSPLLAERRQQAKTSPEAKPAGSQKTSHVLGRRDSFMDGWHANKLHDEDGISMSKAIGRYAASQAVRPRQLGEWRHKPERLNEAEIDELQLIIQTSFLECMTREGEREHEDSPIDGADSDAEMDFEDE